MEKKTPKEEYHGSISDEVLYRLPVEFATVVVAECSREGLSKLSVEAVRRFARVYRGIGN